MSHVFIYKKMASEKRTISISTLNKWKLEFPWLIYEAEKGLATGLFCSICLKFEEKLKGSRNFDGKFIQGEYIFLLLTY